MERLTAHSKYNGTPTPNLKTIGDFCMKIPFCDDYDSCEGCPVRTMIDRLCEYEDTGLTPAEIMELKEKESDKIRRCQDDREHMTARVTVNGINIFGRYFNSYKLFINCFGDKVDIVIDHHSRIVEVYCRNQHVESFYL